MCTRWKQPPGRCAAADPSARPPVHQATAPKIKKEEPLVSGQLALRWTNAAVDRRLSRDLAKLRGRTNYAHAEVMAIGQVTRDAIDEATLNSLACDQAERMSPSGGDTYRLLACTGAVEMTQVIRTVRRGW